MPHHSRADDGQDMFSTLVPLQSDGSTFYATPQQYLQTELNSPTINRYEKMKWLRITKRNEYNEECQESFL